MMENIYYTLQNQEPKVGSTINHVCIMFLLPLGRSATESLNSLEKSSVVEKHLDFKEMDSPQPLPVEISKQLKEVS